MYIIIVLSFLFYTYTYYYILLIIFSRDYLEIFGGRFGKVWIAPFIYLLMGEGPGWGLRYGKYVRTKNIKIY